MCTKRENPISGMEVFQSNIYYSVIIKAYIVSTQEISCIHRRDSCFYTRVLCMHKSVVHAQECCACTRILCMHENLDSLDKLSNFSWYVLVRLFHLCIMHLLCSHNNRYCSETSLFPRDLIFSFIYTCTVD